jgi:squalene cyclase
MTTVDPLEYLKILKFDPRPKLFGYAAPGPVRALALKALEGRKDSDFLLRHAIKDCPRYEARKKLLKTWTASGHWGIERLFMRKNGEAAARDRALVNAIRNLYQLNLYLWFGEEGDEQHLEALADLVLERARPDGSIHFISENATWTEGLAGTVFTSDHWGGFAVSILTLYGYEDEKLNLYINHLKVSQREDGGWLPEYFAKEGETVSHPLHTISNAFALSAVEPKSAATIKAVEFLLSNWTADSFSYKRAGQYEWFKLEVPSFTFNALNILSIAAEAGFASDDPRIDRILKWLIGEQQKDGTWPVSANREVRKNEELFLSLRVAMVIKQFYSPLPEISETD